MEMVILLYAGLTEYLNHRNVWVVCRISELNITSNLSAGPTRKGPPKPWLMMMEEIDLDYESNKDTLRIKGRECHTVNSVNPAMQSCRNRKIVEN